MASVTVFAPATVGNVGPGFDVLGLAVDGIGDRITLDLREGSGLTVTVTGRDAKSISDHPDRNAASIAASAVFRKAGANAGFRLSVHKGLPVSGGMGGSAASSCGGALAAALALGWEGSTRELAEAALEGESVVAGRHLDNIAACILGGLALVRSGDPIDLVSLPIAKPWWLALVTPQIRLETKSARAVLPRQSDRSLWIQQMANTAAVSAAFATGDLQLLKRSMVDLYAEPCREALIPHLHDVKRAAMENGAYGCSISGAGPTVFAVAPDESKARICAEAMEAAFATTPSTVHVGAISLRGAHRL